MKFALYSLILFATMSFASDRKDVDVDQDQQQEQQQDQDQYQGQNQNQEQFNDQANAQNIEVFAAGASSGNSSSDCQKIRDIRFADALLFGLRWDVTDKDCRRLDLASAHYARGNTYFADTLTCSVPFVLETFGDVNACKDALEKSTVEEALRARVEELERSLHNEREERFAAESICDRDKERMTSEYKRLSENCTK